MPFVYCEINHILTWSKYHIIFLGNRVPTFTTSDARFYGSTVTLSTQDNAKLLQQ